MIEITVNSHKRKLKIEVLEFMTLRTVSVLFYTKKDKF